MTAPLPPCLIVWTRVQPCWPRAVWASEAVSIRAASERINAGLLIIQSSVSVTPARRSQLESLNLAGRSAGHLLDELDPRRDFVRRQPRACEPAQLLFEFFPAPFSSDDHVSPGGCQP